MRKKIFLLTTNYEDGDSGDRVKLSDNGRVVDCASETFTKISLRKAKLFRETTAVEEIDLDFPEAYDEQIKDETAILFVERLFALSKRMNSRHSMPLNQANQMARMHQLSIIPHHIHNVVFRLSDGKVARAIIRQMICRFFEMEIGHRDWKLRGEINESGHVVTLFMVDSTKQKNFERDLLLFRLSSVFGDPNYIFESTSEEIERAKSNTSYPMPEGVDVFI